MFILVLHYVDVSADAAPAAEAFSRRAIRNRACTLCIDVIFSSLYEWPPVSSSRGILPVAVEEETDGRLRGAAGAVVVAVLGHASLTLNVIIIASFLGASLFVNELAMYTASFFCGGHRSVVKLSPVSTTRVDGPS